MKLRLAMTLIARESRGARARMVFFVACLALGVGAVTGVSALISAVHRNLRAESRELIAADIKISSRAPMPEVLFELLGEIELEASCSTRELATMLAAPAPASGGPGMSRLVELKAASAGYPFYGELVTNPPGIVPEILGADEILIASELMATLELTPGAIVQIGGQEFHVLGALISEPDRLEFGLSLGPRVLVSDGGLARASLLEFGSRVQYAHLLRLSPTVQANELRAYKERLVEGLGAVNRIRVQTHREAQPSVRRWLENVERYLGLIALLSLLLGGVGVAQVVRVWIEERTQAVAIQRSLGLRPREILQLYLVHILALAGLASLIGCIAGLLLPFAATYFAPTLFESKSALTPPLPVFLRGFSLGLVIATIFALGPLTAIYKVSPARVLRHEAVPLAIPLWVRLTTLLVLLAGILVTAWIQAADLAIGAIFTGGLLALTGILILGARLAMWMATRLPRASLNLYLRHGLSSLARPGAGTTPTIVALGLGVHVIAAMLLVENRLSAELRGGLPESAPSIFLVDVQPDQWPGIEELLARHGSAFIDSTPVAMARLSHIDDRAVRDIAEEREEHRGRARWVLTREQRLTWREELAPSNELIEGEWFHDDDIQEISLEERFAGDLGAVIGTRLTFDLQGWPVEFTVTSIRTVDWASFSINFFLIVEPGSLEGAPHTRLASARLDAQSEQPMQDELVSGFRNVTLLRLRPMLEKLAAILERIALGVRALGWIAVLTGLAILSGAVAAGGLRRRKEVALQKTLGMTRGGVTLLLGIEYGMIGLVAGLCGTGAAYLLSWAFLTELLNLEPELPWSWFPLFVVGSALLAALCGLFSSLRALAVRPTVSLR